MDEDIGFFNAPGFVASLPLDLFREQFIRGFGLVGVFSKLCSGNDDLSRFTNEDWSLIRNWMDKLGAPANLSHGQMQVLAKELAARAVTRA